jgi:hypothetical protein
MHHIKGAFAADIMAPRFRPLTLGSITSAARAFEDPLFAEGALFAGYFCLDDEPSIA